MTSEQLKELSKRIEGIKGFLKIEAKRLDLKEQELKTHDPEFWNDPKLAQTVMKELRENKLWVDKFKGIKDNIPYHLLEDSENRIWAFTRKDHKFKSLCYFENNNQNHCKKL